MAYDFSKLNETDIREEIVRPFLHRLGYAPGTPNNIRTEQVLRYDKQYLGRKDPRNDPVLRGRADYICDVLDAASWVVEAKAPQKELSQEDADQAHTYAAHPEVAAFYFLLTNGSYFRLYTSAKPAKPILVWRLEEADQRWVEIENTLGPRAIAHMTKLLTPATGKPLGRGLKPSVEIVGGVMTYEGYVSSTPGGQEVLDRMRGLRNAVTGGYVGRDEFGIIRAGLRTVGGLAQMDELNRMSGLGSYELSSADEYISFDRARPTIFRGLLEAYAKPGTKVGPPLVEKEAALPFGIKVTAYSQATGYLEENRFKGTFIISYKNHYDVPAAMRELIAGKMSLDTTIKAYGDFEIVFKD